MKSYCELPPVSAFGLLLAVALAAGAVWAIGSLAGGGEAGGGSAREHPAPPETAQGESVATTGPVVYAGIDISAVRGELRPLRLRRTRFVYKCSECHRTFESDHRYPILQAEHVGLTLEHGRNDYCLNCHHRINRDAYTAHDGSEIPADRPWELCGKCHGLTLRDWAHGVHGRRIGYWRPNMGDQRRLACTRCHDPHRPKFGKIHPKPGPAYGQALAGKGDH